MGICGSQNKKPCQETFTIQEFKFQALLGKGGFGQVWKVKEKKTQKTYALKILDKALMIKRKSVNQILNERLILTQFMTPLKKGIIQMQAAFQDKRKLYILMQFVQGKTLRQYLQKRHKFQQQQKKFIIFSLVKILQCLYEKQVIHHDFKPENIIIDKNCKLLLIDFGLSSFCYGDNRNFNGGTLEYLAPQILSNYNHFYTADYYSLGVIIYQIFFHKRLYNAKTITEMLVIQKMKPFNQQNFPQIKQLDNLAQDFLTKLLQKTQINRLGHNGIKQILQHPYIKGIEQDIDSGLISKNHLENTANSQDSKSQNEQSLDNPFPSQVFTHLLQQSYVQQMFKEFDFMPVKKHPSSKYVDSI